jgi:WD40 repeat protein
MPVSGTISTIQPSHAPSRSQSGLPQDCLPLQPPQEASFRPSFELTVRSLFYEVYSVAFSPVSQLLASSDNKGNIRLWNTATGAIQRKFAHPQGTDPGSLDVLCVAFSPDGRLLASASNDSPPPGRMKLHWKV